MAVVETVVYRDLMGSKGQGRDYHPAEVECPRTDALSLDDPSTFWKAYLLMDVEGEACPHLEQSATFQHPAAAAD